MQARGELGPGLFPCFIQNVLATQGGLRSSRRRDRRRQLQSGHAPCAEDQAPRTPEARRPHPRPRCVPPPPGQRSSPVQSSPPGLYPRALIRKTRRKRRRPPFGVRTPRMAPKLPHSVEELRSAGNLSFRNGQFCEAATYYSLALRLMLERGTTLPPPPPPFSPPGLLLSPRLPPPRLPRPRSVPVLGGPPSPASRLPPQPPPTPHTTAP